MGGGWVGEGGGCYSDLRKIRVTKKFHKHIPYVRRKLYSLLRTEPNTKKKISVFFSPS